MVVVRTNIRSRASMGVVPPFARNCSKKLDPMQILLHPVQLLFSSTGQLLSDTLSIFLLWRFPTRLPKFTISTRISPSTNPALPQSLGSQSLSSCILCHVMCPRSKKPWGSKTTANAYLLASVYYFDFQIAPHFEPSKKVLKEQNHIPQVLKLLMGCQIRFLW